MNTMYQTLARITNKRKYTLQIESAINISNQKQICNASNGDNETGNNIETVVSMIEKQSTIDVEHAAINLNMFLDKYKYGKRTKEDMTKVIIALIVESIQNAEKDRKRCLFNIVNRISYKTTENDDNDARSVLKVEKEKKSELHHY
jgi:hypothetical protein